MSNSGMSGSGSSNNKLGQGGIFYNPANINTSSPATQAGLILTSNMQNNSSNLNRPPIGSFTDSSLPSQTAQTQLNNSGYFPYGANGRGIGERLRDIAQNQQNLSNLTNNGQQPLQGQIVYGDTTTGGSVKRNGLSQQDYLKAALYSSQLFFQGGRLNYLDPLDLLTDLDHLFINPVIFGSNEVSYNTYNQYDVLSPCASRLFSIVEKRKRKGLCCTGCCENTFLYASIVNAFEEECITISGTPSGIFKIKKVEINGAPTTLGYVMTDEACCSYLDSYSIKDRSGNLCFKIKKETTNLDSSEYEVFGNGLTRIGRLSKYWGNFPICPNATTKAGLDLAHTYGISFPQDMNLNEKGLMFGALFAIHWKHYSDKNREAKFAREACCCVSMLVVFILLVLLGFAFLAVYVIYKSS